MTACEKQYEAIQAMLAQERRDEAVTALEQLVEECDDHSAAHFDLGNLYYAGGRIDLALNQLEKCVAIAPDNPDFLRGFADLVYSAKKDASRALPLYVRLISILPEDLQALMMAGHLCVVLRQFDDALVYYRRILGFAPDHVDARQFVDQILARRNAGHAGQTPESVYQHCHDLVGRGDVAMAIAGLERLTAENPDFSLAYNDLGVLYYQQGDKDRCIQCYEKAVAVDPENGTFRKNMADFYLAEQGNVEKALEIYLSVLKENPEDIDALMVAGHICSALGKRESAKTFYNRVLDVEPWNFEASERLETLAS